VTTGGTGVITINFSGANWLVNGLEIRRAIDVVDKITLTNPGSSSLLASDSGPVTINGTSTLAEGTLVTLTTTSGTISTTDASLDSGSVPYSGTQVAVDSNGSFSFTIAAPYTVGSPTITAVAVTGAAQKSSNTLVTFTTPPSQRFDFNYANATFPNGGVSENN